MSKVPKPPPPPNNQQKNKNMSSKTIVQNTTISKVPTIQKTLPSSDKEKPSPPPPSVQETAPPSVKDLAPPSVKKITPPSVKEIAPSGVKELPPSVKETTQFVEEKEIKKENSTGPNLSSVCTNASVDDNFNSVIDEKLRPCYCLAPLKGTKAFLTVGNDKELMVLKVSPSQQIFTTDFFTLVNVRHGVTKHISGLKIIKAGAILKGKTFDINQQETEEKINACNIQLEGVGRHATELNDQELTQKEEGATIEKMTLKVVWVGPKIFGNKQSAKVITRQGNQMLISLDVPHHFKVHQDRVYIFTKTVKTNNWRSSSPFLNEVIMKFKTTPTTKIYLVDNPPLAFIEMGKDIGRVVCIDQKLTLFDQCDACWKTRLNRACNQSSCSKQGIQTEPNKKFKTTFAIMDQEENVDTYNVWSDQLKDYNEPIPDNDEDGLASVIVLSDLEKHFKEKLISYKKKRDTNENYEQEKFIIDVHIKTEENAMDIE